jgi:hypothetical protein
MTVETIRLAVDLPSGVHAVAVIARDAIGVAVNGRACLAHRGWMTAAQLRLVASQATELADTLEESR